MSVVRRQRRAGKALQSDVVDVSATTNFFDRITRLTGFVKCFFILLIL
jgi:hypothetical protein